MAFRTEVELLAELAAAQEQLRTRGSLIRMLHKRVRKWQCFWALQFLLFLGLWLVFQMMHGTLAASIKGM